MSDYGDGVGMNEMQQVKTGKGKQHRAEHSCVAAPEPSPKEEPGTGQHEWIDGQPFKPHGDPQRQVTV